MKWKESLECRADCVLLPEQLQMHEQQRKLTNIKKFLSQRLCSLSLFYFSSYLSLFLSLFFSVTTQI